MKITITQANGWTKLFEPTKAISLVGSADFADIHLSSSSISPIQIQILSDRQFPTGIRVVNLDGQTKVNTIQGSFLLEPFAVHDISEDDEIALGEYLLKFQPTQVFPQRNSASHIQAQVKFPDTVLQPNLDLTGYLVITNAGEKDACQFNVMLDGLPQDCYQLDPVPMLHPGGQEEVGVRLFHRKTSPPAGNLDLVLTISAPNSYPGEAYKLKHSLYVTPDFSQSLEIIDDLTAEVETAHKNNNRTPASTISNINAPISNVQPIISNTAPVDSFIAAANAEQAAPIVKPPETKTDQSGSDQTLNAPPTADLTTSTSADGQPSSDKPVVEGVEPSSQAILQNARELDLKKVKIVRNKSEDYWDES